MAKVNASDHPPMYAFWILQAALEDNNHNVMAVDKDPDLMVYRVLLSHSGGYLTLKDPVDGFPSERLLSQILLMKE